MESVAKFKKWHSERMGHPIGVLLAVEAIGDLEHRVNDLDSCAKTSNSRVVELKKDNDRLVEENAELREMLIMMLDSPEAICMPENKTVRESAIELLNK